MSRGEWPVLSCITSAGHVPLQQVRERVKAEREWVREEWVTDGKERSGSGVA